MKTSTLTLSVPDDQAKNAKAALEKDLHILCQALRLESTGTVAVGFNPGHVTVSLTSEAIREHFDPERDLEMCEKLTRLSDERLYEIASAYLNNEDQVWDSFRDWCCEIVNLAAEEGEGRTDASV